MHRGAPFEQQPCSGRLAPLRDHDDLMPMALRCQPGHILGLSSGIERIGPKADDRHIRHRFRAGDRLLAPQRDHRHPGVTRSRQSDRLLRPELTGVTAERHDGVDMDRVVGGRPDEQPSRRQRKHHHQQEDHYHHEGHHDPP